MSALVPEPAQTTNDSTDLERQVGDLLDEMQSATQQLAADAEIPAPPDGQLAAAVTAMAQEPGAVQAPPVAARPVVPPLQDDPGSEPDLAAAVQQLIDEKPATPGTPSEPGSVQQLDQQLAGRADEVIAGEFQDEAAALSDEPAEPAPAPVVAAEPVAAAPAPAAAPLPPPPEPKPPVHKEPADRATKPTMTPVAEQPSAAAELVLKVLSAASAPLNGRPHLRDIFGWVALVQAFMAACVWVYVLFVRSDRPVDPPPVTPAKEAAKEDHGGGGHESGGHDSGHQAKKPTKTSKKPAKKTTHASAASGSHH